MRPFGLLPVMVLLLTAPTRAAVPAYDILDLGPTTDQNASINDLGQVALVRDRSVIRYADDSGTKVLVSSQGYPVLGGINNRGQVSFADSRYPHGYGIASIFRHTDGIGSVKLGEDYGLDIPVNLTRPNDRGDVAFGGNSGIVSYASDLGHDQLLSWLPFLDISFVNGINNAGTILYGFTSSYIQYQGFSTSGAWTYPGIDVDVHPLQWASALNNHGDIAGSIGNGIWIRWADGTVTQIKEFGFLAALNDAGMAVGFDTIGADPGIALAYRDPWLYSASGVQPLNALIDPALGWTLAYASSINNRGQIAGTGFLNGERHAFRLTPTAIPEPGSLALLAVGLLPLARRRLK